MNRKDRQKATPEQSAENSRQYGIVVLSGVFGVFIVADLIVLLGGPIAIAIPAGVVFGILLAANVLRYLRRHRRATGATPDA